MAKILLVIPPITERIWSNHYHEIYLGLAYIAAGLKKGGHIVRVVDCDASHTTLSGLKKKAADFRPDFVGITALYGSMNNAIKSAAACKRSDNIMVVGGLPATFIPSELLGSNAIDIAVRGEGEATFAEVVAGKQLDAIEGISYKKKGKIIHNKDRGRIADLDTLGIPCREIFPLKRYKIRFKLHNSTAIETTRGCPYGCEFCTQQPKEGAKLRHRSVEMVVRELQEISKYPFIKRVMIVDNDFLTDKDYAVRVLRAIATKGLGKRFYFMFATRVSNMLNFDIELVKRANVQTIFFGIECMSEKHRKAIGKIESEEETEKLFSKLEKAGIDTLPSYMIGYADETPSDIKKTLDFAIRLNSRLFSFNILTPYPGTKYYAKCPLLHTHYNEYDNAHQVIKHKLDLERIFLRMHRKYMFRPGYFSSIRPANIFGRAGGGRIAIFLYYAFFMEVATILRAMKRRIKQPFNRFET